LEEFGLGNAYLGASKLVSQPALGCSRELLHDTGFAHRHEVACRRVGVRPVDGKVVDTHDEFRIGQSSGAHGQSLHRFEVCRASADLWRSFKRALDSRFE
jgi:hypothetical protein